MILNRIPDKIFEVTGSLVGGSGSLLITLQIIVELQNKKSSTLSPVYVLGFLFIYIFWALYGLKFKRSALWLTNGIAAILQVLLLIIVTIVK